MNDMTEYSNHETRKTIRRRRYHPVLNMLLCGVIGTACGLGGGWFAVTHLGSASTVVYQSADTAPSVQTSVNNTDGTMTISEAASKASPSVVEIIVEGTVTNYGIFGGTYTSTGAGSGVIISETGYIITNNHVVKDTNKITVTTYDGKEYEAQLVGTDAKTDIAVIKITAPDLIPAVVGDSSKISQGDTAIVIGNPLGTLGGTVTNGVISAVSRELVIENESMNLIQTDATINSGNSGGGLFDGNGNLIGIVNAKDSGTTSSGASIEGIGFAIPINTAMDVASQLMESGRVTNRATLGVYLDELTRSTQHYKAGLYITDIIHGSGAEAAGLAAYDRIISVDGTEVSSYTDLSRIMRDKKIGETITLKIERDGTEMDVQVTLTGTLDTSTEQG